MLAFFPSTKSFFSLHSINVMQSVCALTVLTYSPPVHKCTPPLTSPIYKQSPSSPDVIWVIYYPWSGLSETLFPYALRSISICIIWRYPLPSAPWRLSLWFLEDIKIFNNLRGDSFTGCCYLVIRSRRSMSPWPWLMAANAILGSIFIS